MKILTVNKFQCEICKEFYDKKEDAEKCESRPIYQDKKVKVGDLVKIKSGDGAGKLAKVYKVAIRDMYYGHYVHERYWHTITVIADIMDDGGGTRILDFDSYEIVNENR